MPTLGELKRGPEIGYKSHAIFVWCECPDCHKQRWKIRSLKLELCQSCASIKRAHKENPPTYFGVDEPKIGDRAMTRTLGYSGRGIMHYVACPKCGQPHWVRRTGIKSVCNNCAPKYKGEKHPAWSERRNKRGYVYVHVKKNNPYYSMSNNGLIAEHRLVMAQHIGRLLSRNEVVHHINGIKSDNRIENLRLLTIHTHNSLIVLNETRDRVAALERTVADMQVTIILLMNILSGVRDSDPRNQNISRYKTPGNLDED